MIKTNFHTHTTYCDAQSSAREMVEAALVGGFDAVGFSGHAFTSFDQNCCMSREKTAAYRAEIAALRAEYAGKIRILCGLEQDLYSDDCPLGYDFIIGSVHYLSVGGEYLPIDESADILRAGVARLYDGDWMRFAEDYFAETAKLAGSPYVDIIGHFDTLVKFNEGNALFDEDDPRYVQAWETALEKIAASGKIVEINGGAVCRGFRSVPYPAPSILRRVQQYRLPVVLNCDCHFAPTMEQGWTIAYSYAKAFGYDDAELDAYAKIVLDKKGAQ